MIAKNLGLKMASLFIALVLAYAVHSTGNASVVSIFVPVELKNIPPDRVVVSPAQRSVQITIRGPSFLIGPLASSPPPLRARLPDQIRDRALVNFQVSDLNLPHSIEVLSIEPAQMEFGLEAVEQYEVPVKVVTTGQLINGLVLEGIDTRPKGLSVHGPRPEVKKVQFVETEPLNLSEVSSSGDFILKIHTGNSRVVSSVNSIVAHVRVSKPPTDRELDFLPVELRASVRLPSVKIMPESVKVSISGPAGLVGDIDPDTIVPYVRILDKDKAGTEIAVRVDVPEGIRVVSVVPSRVSLEREQKDH
jgi:YbbR domain-containing protein